MNTVQNLKAILVCTLFSFLLIGCQKEPGSDQPANRKETSRTEKLTKKKIGSLEQLHVIDNQYLSAQPAKSDFQKMKQMGVKTVINLRSAEETPDLNEKELVEGLGMTYHNVPFSSPGELNDEVFAKTRDLLQTVERPLLLHCSSANRTGAVWIPYLVLDRGVDLEDAVREAKTIGLRSSALEKKARSYVRKMKENSEE